MLNRLLSQEAFWSLKLFQARATHLHISVNNTHENAGFVIRKMISVLKKKIHEIQFIFAHNWRRIILFHQSGIYKPQTLREISYFWCFTGDPIYKNKHYAWRRVHFVIKKNGYIRHLSFGRSRNGTLY